MNHEKTDEGKEKEVGGPEEIIMLVPHTLERQEQHQE